MEGRLFGRTETEKKQQEIIKAKTLLACETERAKLKRCFRESWFGWCIEEHRQFWDCFLREREKHIIVSSQQGSTAPNSHWETSPDTKPDQTG